jgi:hypothetical protein
VGRWWGHLYRLRARLAGEMRWSEQPNGSRRSAAGASWRPGSPGRLGGERQATRSARLGRGHLRGGEGPAGRVRPTATRPRPRGLAEPGRTRLSTGSSAAADRRPAASPTDAPDGIAPNSRPPAHRQAEPLGLHLERGRPAAGRLQAERLRQGDSAVHRVAPARLRAGAHQGGGAGRKASCAKARGSTPNPSCCGWQGRGSATPQPWA